MVAYSFQRQFVADIKAYRKRQTIRGNRKRHAHPGERMQLYFGMRTKHCYKIIPDPLCLSVEPITLCIGRSEMNGMAVGKMWMNDPGERLKFARNDGFKSLHDMWAFWLKTHGAGNWQGVLIKWDPEK